MLINEKVYNGDRKVKYVLEEHPDSDVLLVVFSAFSPLGKPPVYNFTKTLEQFRCNKLFILDDFGSRGSYYLTVRDNDFIEKSVMGLIDEVLISVKLERENVISIGSSKGGYAALYYAIKYGLGEVISGSPPFYIINSLLRSQAYDIIDFLTARTKEDEVNNKLKNEILKAKTFPKINIMVGDKEYHYQEHVKHLDDALQDKGVVYNIEFRDFQKHNDLTKHFPHFIKSIVAERIAKIKFNSVVSSYGNIIQGSELVFKIDCNGEDLTYAWYLYKDGIPIEKHWYTDDNTIKWKTNAPGDYKIQFFIKDKNGNILTKFTEVITVI